MSAALDVYERLLAARRTVSDDEHKQYEAERNRQAKAASVRAKMPRVY